MHQTHYLGVLWPHLQSRSSTGAWSKHKSVPEVTVTPWPPGGRFHLRSMSVFSAFLQESEQTWLWLLFGNSVFLKVPFKRQKERKKNVQLWLIKTAPGAGTSTPCFFDTSGFIKEASDQKLEWNIQLERHKSEAITVTQEPWVKSGASPMVYPC